MAYRGITTIRTFANRNLLTVSFLTYVAYLVFFISSNLYGKRGHGQSELKIDSDTLLLLLPTELGLALSILLVVTILGWWRACRVNSPINPGGLKFVLFPLAIVSIIFVCVVIWAGSDKADPIAALVTPRRILLLLSVSLLIGIFEETLFRGIILNGFLSQSGTLRALAATSFLFGATHYVNWIGGQPLGATTTQVIHACAAGFMYGALVLRIGTLWPVILFHAIWDSTISLGASILAASGSTPNASTTSGDLSTLLPLLIMEITYALLVVWSWRRMVNRML